MSQSHRATVVNVFDTPEAAHRAIEELRIGGFHDSQITMIMHHHQRGSDVTDLDSANAARVSGQSKRGEGAAVGAVTGGVLGGALAVATAFLPGVGLVLTVGTLAAAVFGVAAGAAGGGVIGALIGQDFPEEEARFYERQLKAGRILVGVKANGRTPEAGVILQHCGGAAAPPPAVPLPSLPSDVPYMPMHQ
jgi:hypothetical protein